MDELMDSIEQIKTKLMDSEYMTIMDKMKIVHDTKDWNWSSLVEIMIDEEIPDHLSEMAHIKLNGYTCAELPREMAVQAGNDHPKTEHRDLVSGCPWS